MSRIFIGTSGYSYTEWVGPVYPPHTHTKDFLSYYATLFSTVELNFSYYRMPTKEQLLTMHKEAPSLLFSLKAHQSLTHSIDPHSWKQSAHLFMDAVSALSEHNSLGAVLLQVPHSFHYDVDQRRYLYNLVTECSSFPLAIEFRNSQWYNNRTIETLRKQHITLVSLDLPHQESALPMMDVMTSFTSYIRLHGRNASSWWGSDVASRYNYLYSDKELESIKKRVCSLADFSKDLYLYFNNHPQGYAVKNALTLRELLKKEGEYEL